MEFLRSAKLLSFMTLLSRILGLCRDMVTTCTLAGSASDALYFAWTVPNLFRKLFGEGALSSAFIPVFARVLNRRGQSEAFRLAGVVITAVALCLGGVVILLLALTFLVPEAWIRPFFDGDGAKMARTLGLIRILLPYLVVVCILAQCQGVLNTLKDFFLPALSPIVLNAAWILAALAAAWGAVAPGGRDRFIALGIMAGGGLQVLLFGYALRRRRFPLRPSLGFRSPEVREVMVTTLPMVLGTSAVQFNILVDRMVVYARVPGDGGVTHLFLGNRLMQFPFALVAMALTTAVFPLLARLSAEGDREGLKENLTGALRISFFFSLPATVGLLLLAHPTLALFFQRGTFTPDRTAATAAALRGYVAGLPFLCAVMLLTRAFYALGEWRVPLFASVATVAVNLTFDFLLVGPLAEAGVALATSLSALFQTAVLFAALRRRIGPFAGDAFLEALPGMSILTLLLAGTVGGSQAWLAGLPGADRLLPLTARVFLPLFLGLAVYLLPARWICPFEYGSLREVMARRRKASRR